MDSTGALTPAIVNGVASGVEIEATSQTPASIATAIASAPSIQPPTTRSGSRCQSSSVARVWSSPRAST